MNRRERFVEIVGLTPSLKRKRTLTIEPAPDAGWWIVRIKVPKSKQGSGYAIRLRKAELERLLAFATSALRHHSADV